jgi:ribosomal protein S18 acetylase RimI-like enzyme
MNLKKVLIKTKVTNNSILEIRSINIKDLKNLRKWKNKYKEFFFSKHQISQAQQKNWYRLYAKRPYDLMFILSFDKDNFGCMGIRWLQNKWDIYNVILGKKEYGDYGYMGQALKLILNFSNKLKSAPVTLKVLKKNPAVKWYKKQGFKIIKYHDDYYIMKLFDFRYIS